MTRPIVRIHNAETGEIYDGEMPDDMYEIYLEKKLEEEESQAKLNAKLSRQQAICEKLGISIEEAKLLLS